MSNTATTKNLGVNQDTYEGQAVPASYKTLAALLIHRYTGFFYLLHLVKDVISVIILEGFFWPEYLSCQNVD